MKLVMIYSIGSCNAATRVGSAEILLECDRKTKYLKLDINDTTANRCIIEGLIEGVKQLTKPCNVNLITSTPIGIKKANRGKGINIDLVRCLINELESKKCTFEFDVWEGRGEELKSLVVSEGKKARQDG